MSEVFGVIAPHPPIIVEGVGGSRREPAHDTIAALGTIGQALAHHAPETLVLMSPHAPALADAIAVDAAEEHRGSLGDFGDWTPHRWQGDPDLAQLIAERLEDAGVPTQLRSADARLRGGSLDHGALVPLSFLDPQHRFRLVVLSLSYLPYAEHRRVGEAARQAAESLGRRVVFIASGDLSHRLTPDAPVGYSARAKELDAEIVRLVSAGRLAELPKIPMPLIEAGGECGLRSFIALGGFCGDDPVPTKVLSYEGPWGVGYLNAIAGQAGVEALRAVSAGERGGDSPTSTVGFKGGSPGHDESEVVRLARATIEARVHGSDAPPAVLSGDYPDRAGAFVSLHIGDALRGCIGTILPTRATLAEEVAANAIEAATGDPRFSPLRSDELNVLDVKVDVLHEPEACKLSDLDPKTYGVIVSSGWRRGLLLPDLEGVDDAEDQVRIALRKAGIRPGEPCSYERFKVDRYT